MYCPNCGKELIDNSKFCSYCGFEIIQTQQKTVKTNIENKSHSKLIIFLSIILPSILFVTNFILGKLITGIETIYIKSVLSTIINFCIKISFLSSLIIASFEILKKKNIISIISIIISSLYIAYCIVISTLSFVKFLGIDKKESFNYIYALSNLAEALFLIIGLLIVLIFILRKKAIFNTIAIILFGLAGASSIIYSTTQLIHINKLLKEINALTSSISKSYNDTSKKTGTWNVWLRYDDPDQTYSKYDNLYSKRSRFCDKEYAIKNAKEWLLVEHPRARNIYVDDCIFEGYSTSPID